MTADRPRRPRRDCDLYGTMPATPTALELEHDGHVGLVRRFLATTPAGRAAVRLLGYEDAEQQGRCGVVHAARTFDPERGARFTTHAWSWIGAYLRTSLRCLDRGTPASLDELAEHGAEPAGQWEEPDIDSSAVEEWLRSLGRDGEICAARWFEGALLRELAAVHGITSQGVRLVIEKVARRVRSLFYEDVA